MSSASTRKKIVHEREALKKWKDLSFLRFRLVVSNILVYLRFVTSAYVFELIINFICL